MANSAQPTDQLQRHLAGLCGLLMVTAGIVLSIWPLGGDSTPFWQGSSVKAGLALLAFWLAYPELDRLPGWLVTTILVVLLIFAIRPRLMIVVSRVAIFLLPLFFVIWLLSRGQRRTGR
jgi:hypothetical protein